MIYMVDDYHDHHHHDLPLSFLSSPPRSGVLDASYAHTFSAAGDGAGFSPKLRADWDGAMACHGDTVDIGLLGWETGLGVSVVLSYRGAVPGAATDQMVSHSFCLIFRGGLELQ